MQRQLPQEMWDGNMGTYNIPSVLGIEERHTQQMPVYFCRHHCQDLVLSLTVDEVSVKISAAPYINSGL